MIFISFVIQNYVGGGGGDDDDDDIKQTLYAPWTVTTE